MVPRTMSYFINQNLSIELIKQYGKRPHLWNVRDRNYNNRQLRDKAWKEISSAIGIPEQDARHRMKTLTGTYRSIMSRERIKKRSAKNGDERVPGSKWFGLKYFEYLKNRESNKQDKYQINTETNIRRDDAVEETIDDYYSQSSSDVSICGNTNSLPVENNLVEIVDIKPDLTDSLETVNSHNDVEERNSSPQLVESFKLMAKPTNEQTIDPLREYMPRDVNVSSDPYYTYGQYVANEMRKYDSRTLAHVKRAIAGILFEADIGTLPH